MILEALVLTKTKKQSVSLTNTGRRLSLACDGPELRGVIRYAGSYGWAMYCVMTSEIGLGPTVCVSFKGLPFFVSL